MTAAIVSATPGSPRLGGAPDGWTFLGLYTDGDSLRYPRAVTPGQLWERVGEATPNLAILSHATLAAIWEVGCRPKWRDERGPVARDIHRSGIIRAKVRQ